MLQAEALVVGRDELADSWQRLTLYLPQIASRAKPGQLLALQSGASPLEPLLKRALPVLGRNTGGETVDLLLPPAMLAPILRRTGDRLEILGPIGRGWNLHEQTRNVVLIGTDHHAAALLFVAAEATARGWNATLLVGGTADRPPLPTALVPAAVEYQWAQAALAEDAALDLLDAPLLAWADALYTTLPLAAYPRLADRIRSGRVHWAPGFAQGLLTPPMACFVGICDTCRVVEARHTWRACVDGPQCDVRDFVR